MSITNIIKKLEKSFYNAVSDDFKVELINMYQIKIDMCEANIENIQKHDGNIFMYLFQSNIEQYQNRIKRLENRKSQVYRYIKDPKLKQELLEYII